MPAAPRFAPVILAALVILLAGAPLLAQEIPGLLWDVTISDDEEGAYWPWDVWEAPDGHIEAFGTYGHDYYYYEYTCNPMLWTVSGTGEDLGMLSGDPGIPMRHWQRTNLPNGDFLAIVIDFAMDVYDVQKDRLARFSAFNQVVDQQWEVSPPNFPGYNARRLYGYDVIDNGLEEARVAGFWSTHVWLDEYEEYMDYPILAQYDLQGQLLQTTSYEDLRIQLMDACFDDLGQTLVFGREDSPSDAAYNPYRLVWLGTDGAVMRDIEVDIPGTSDSFGEGTIHLLEGGDFLIAGEGHSTDEHSLLVRHDPAGEQRWATVLEYEYLADIAFLPDGTILASVYDYNWQEDPLYTNALVLLDSATGTVLDEAPLDWGNGYVFDMCTTSNGDVLLSGFVHNSQADLDDTGIIARLSSSVGVDDNTRDRFSLVPAHFALSPPYPNPFNASTTVGVDLPTMSPLTVTVYDLLGRPVRVLHDGPAAPGKHRFVVDARGLATGTYLLRAETEDERQVRRMLFLK